DFGEPAKFAIGDSAVAQLERADQGAMNDEIGIAADGRREMGIASEVQAKVSDILGRVECLCLGTKYHVVQYLFVNAALRLGQNSVEDARLDHLALRKANADGAQIVAEREE